MAVGNDVLLHLRAKRFLEVLVEFYMELLQTGSQLAPQVPLHCVQVVVIVEIEPHEKCIDAEGLPSCLPVNNVTKNSFIVFVSFFYRCITILFSSR